jgi:hypothetical protein
MAKSIALRLADEASSFAFVKLDREKLYGRKERQVVDPEGQRCYPAWLSSDGAALVPPGGLALVYVDDGFATVERSALKAVDEQGAELPLQPSTLGVEQTLVPATPQDLLDHVITTVYQLQAETLGPALGAALAAGQLFRAPFNYRDDYALEVIFLVRNEAGIFGLVGKPSNFGFIQRELVPTAPSVEDDDLGDDLDFTML